MVIRVRKNKLEWGLLAACLALSLLGCGLSQVVATGAPPAPGNQPGQATETPQPGRAGLNASDLPAVIQAQAVPPSGSAPLAFRWDPLPGAASYLLVVAQANPYRVLWIWTGQVPDNQPGQAIQVAYGDPGNDDPEGLGELAADLKITPSTLLVAPPALDPGQKYLWSVLAYDSSGQYLGSSGRLPVP